MTQFTGHDLHCLRGGRMVFGGLNFHLAAGDALILVGPNGSGKSTLLRIMAGLLQPVIGWMEWDGRPVQEDPEERRRRLHYVGHLDAVKPMLTVTENLKFWAGLRTAPSAAGIADTLAALSLSGLADLPGRMLSAGQKRRVNLARILVAEAPLWLLDEPTTALDRQAIAALEAAIARHREQGGMVVLSTHAPITMTDARTLDLKDHQVDTAPMDAPLELDY